MSQRLGNASGLKIKIVESFVARKDNYDHDLYIANDDAGIWNMAYTIVMIAVFISLWNMNAKMNVMMVRIHNLETGQAQLKSQVNILSLNMKGNMDSTRNHLYDVLTHVIKKEFLDIYKTINTFCEYALASLMKSDEIQVIQYKQMTLTKQLEMNERRQERRIQHLEKVQRQNEDAMIPKLYLEKRTNDETTNQSNIDKNNGMNSEKRRK